MSVKLLQVPTFEGQLNPQQLREAFNRNMQEIEDVVNFGKIPELQLNPKAATIFSNGPPKGYLYYDKSLNVPRYWDGTQYINLGGIAGTTPPGPIVDLTNYLYLPGKITGQTLLGLTTETTFVIKPGSGSYTGNLFQLRDFADNNLFKATTSQIFIGPTINTAGTINIRATSPSNFFGLRGNDSIGAEIGVAVLGTVQTGTTGFVLLRSLVIQHLDEAIVFAGTGFEQMSVVVTGASFDGGVARLSSNNMTLSGHYPGVGTTTPTSRFKQRQGTLLNLDFATVNFTGTVTGFPASSLPAHDHSSSTQGGNDLAPKRVHITGAADETLLKIVRNATHTGYWVEWFRNATEEIFSIDGSNVVRIVGYADSGNLFEVNAGTAGVQPFQVDNEGKLDCFHKNGKIADDVEFIRLSKNRMLKMDLDPVGAAGNNGSVEFHFYTTTASRIYHFRDLTGTVAVLADVGGMPLAGAIPYGQGSTSAMTVLAPGTNGQFMQMVAGLPAWHTMVAGDLPAHDHSSGSQGGGVINLVAASGGATPLVVKGVLTSPPIYLIEVQNPSGAFIGGFDAAGDIYTHTTISFTSVGATATLNTSLLSGVRTWTLPDATGTIALTSDIPIVDDARTWGTLQKFPDNKLNIVGSSDASKIAVFEVDGFTTATTRTFTLPNASGTVALTSDIPTIDSARTWATLQTFKTSTIKFVDPTDATKTAIFSLSGASTGADLTLAWAGTADRTVTIPYHATNFTLASRRDNTFLLTQTISLDGTSLPFLTLNDTGGGFKTDIMFSGTANRTHTVPDVSGAFAVAGGFNLAGQTSSISTTAIVTSPPPGLYTISFYLECTTAGTAGTVTVNFHWTDDNGAQTYNSAALSLSVTGRLATNSSFGVYPASSNISYSTTVAGALGSPQYRVVGTVVQVPL